MPPRLPPLPLLRLFEAAGRQQSFKLAEALGVTPSAVRHGVNSPEKRLGVALLRASQ
jgi:LysR family transcriptional regulator, glycine cleavage system transcriptional activator